MSLKNHIYFLWLLMLVYFTTVCFCQGFPKKYFLPAAKRAMGWELSLWSLGLICVVLTLIAHRPDVDDAFYVNLAVGVADSPHLPLLQHDTLHGIANLPLILPTYKVHAVELLSASVSFLTGISAIYVSHLIIPSIAGLFVVFAYAKLFRVLLPLHWLWGVVAVLVIFIFVGDTHPWYSNFSFVRLHQGKAIFLSIFVPLIITYALQFSITPTLQQWLLLSAAQVSAVGMTSTALWIAPIVSCLSLFSAWRPTREESKVLLFGLLASSYVVILAVLFRSKTQAVLEAVPEFTLPSESLLKVSFESVFGTGLLSYTALFGILVAWCVCDNSLARRLSIFFPLGFLVFLFNPYLAELVASRITSVPTYWRVFWVLPVPALMAIVFTSILFLGEGKLSPRTRVVAFLSGLLLFASTIPRFSTLSPQNYVQLKLPSLKVDNGYKIASLLVESVGRGTYVLAPQEVSAWITTFHHHPYPLVSRQHYLYTMRPYLGDGEVSRRIQLANYVDGSERPPNSAALFRSSLVRYQLQGVCFNSSASWGDEIRSVLTQEGFARIRSSSGFEIWVRQVR
ncbi:DUF6077 domain-containing protein [Coleofasciculus sp. FACHB-SPT36]|uniref:DUF6077 domain-containing protein n=1 Tax=Cyanophyceae TaxID=3028117 RepID=UPI00168AC42C|nr:DUF6077 domain-containing protein [Coleofasciculus sp. FACHB-SPT36]MBD2540503.1 hypothetical protein [Coleofasciculus sp. FACHB-SPT36]